MIHGHGDDIYQQAHKLRANFSSNVVPNLHAEELYAHLASLLPSIDHYPEVDAFSLKQVLADKLAAGPEQILVCNGATEAIYLVAQAFSQSSSAILIPTFSEYEDACVIHKHQLNFIRSIHDFRGKESLLWICNPNNPTGQAYSAAQICELAAQYPHCYFIIDQSYIAFVEDEYAIEASHLAQHQNIIIIQSLTKHYAIPALRVGYLLAHSAVIQRILRFKMPWSVNQLGIEAAIFLLKLNKLSFDKPLLKKNMHAFMLSLQKIEALSLTKTLTHFVLCRVKTAEAFLLKKYLLEKHGILIRDASNFRGLDEHYIRLACQSPAENELLIKALKAWTL